MSNIKNKTYELALDLQNMSKHASDIKHHSSNIKRLIKRTIAQDAEDRLAEFLYESLEDKEIEIYINGRLGKICPDIIIIKNNVVIGIVELKINFGWCRNIFDPVDEKGKKAYKGKSYLNKRLKQFEKLKNKTILFDDTAREEKSKKVEREITISDKCNISLVSSSQENYRGEKHDMISDYKSFINRKPEYKELLDFYVITEKYHFQNDAWVDKQTISDSIDELFKTKYGLNKLVEKIKKLC